MVKKIALPTQLSVFKDKIDGIEYLEGLESSENQKQSIYNIFNNPFTYILGASGTGKTQFVLLLIFYRTLTIYFFLLFYLF